MVGRLAGRIASAAAVAGIVISVTSGTSAEAGAPDVSPAPVITSITPASANPSGGTLVTIRGHDLRGTVTFDGSAASVRSGSDSSFLVEAPAHDPGAVDVTVTTRSGSASAPVPFQYFTPNPAPTFNWAYTPVHLSFPGHLSVSCPAKTFCVAVDHDGKALTFDGTGWTAPRSIGLHDVPGIFGTPAFVACSSTTPCLAIDQQGTAVRYSHGSWGPPKNVYSGRILGFSCADSSFCAAVSADRRLIIWHGSTGWAAPKPLHIGRYGTPTAISCPVRGQCFLGTTHGYPRGKGEVLNWSHDRSPAVSARKHFDGAVDGISCSSTRFCLVVNTFNDASVWRQGTGWSRDRLIDPRQNNGADTRPNTIHGVDCVGPTFCAAIDDWGYALTFNGHSWTAPKAIDFYKSDSQYTLSCSGPDFCLAGAGGEVMTYTGPRWSPPRFIDPVFSPTTASCATKTYCVVGARPGAGVEVYDGSTYSAPTMVDPVGGGRLVPSIDCVSPAFCALAVARDVVVMSGGRWAEPQRIASARLTSVGCSSPRFCMAVDRSGRAYRYDGNAWSKPTMIDSGRALVSVACAQDTTHGVVCAAVDRSGYAITYSGGNWMAPQLIDRPGAGPKSSVGLFAVSCGAPTLCVAVDRSGGAVRFNGTTWAQPVGVVTTRQDQQFAASGLTGISCPSVNGCVATDWWSVYAFDGTAWSDPAGILSVAPPSDETQHIACSSLHACYVTLGQGSDAYAGG